MSRNHQGVKRPLDGGPEWGGMGPRGMPGNFGRGRGFPPPFNPMHPGMGMVGPGGVGPMGPAMMDGHMRPRPNGGVPGRGGRGGVRGIPMGGASTQFPNRNMNGPSGRGGFKKPRTDGGVGHSGAGFLNRGSVNGRGGMQHSELLDSINECVTPQSILFLWNDKGYLWNEAHVAQGLLVFSRLVDETCPEDLHKMRSDPDCVSMINMAKKNMSTMRATDCSKIARAMGKLDMQDEELCVGLVDSLKKFLHDSPPIAIAGIMAGLGQVSYRPADSVLQAVEGYVVENAHRLTPKDVKDFLVAFTAMEAPPAPQMINAAILQLPKNFGDTLPKDLATLITALTKLDFRPPGPFIVACANFTGVKLEAAVTGMISPSVLELHTVARVIVGLVAWKFTPPPPMLVLLSQIMSAQIDSADAVDVCDLLEVFASAYWHPSQAVLMAVQEKLEACCPELPLVSLCTSLWSFAIFAFVPKISLQRVYATRIEQEIEDLNAFQLCSILWVFALFRSCTVGVWNTLVSRLSNLHVNDIDESALKYFFQVYLFIRASANTANLESYRMPQRLLHEADKAWRRAKREEAHAAPTEFDLDVKRVLGLLQLHPVDLKTTIKDDLFAVDIWVRTQDVAIMCLSQDKFTMNAVSTAVSPQRAALPSPQPLGQTKMMQNLFTACKVPFVMVPQHIWMSLESDEMKQDFLHRHIRQTTSEIVVM